MKPSGLPFFFDKRKSFNRAKSDATVCVFFFAGYRLIEICYQEKRKHTGQLALVPPVDASRPPITIRKFSPCAEISGYARPVGLM